jgi:Zn-dependent protease
MLNFSFQSPFVCVLLAALLIALTVHEFAHAWASDRLGDPTARLQGRISFNPLVHIDPYGLVFLLFFGFGWGKPVEFDPFNLKNPRKDGALISLAGPASNFIMAILLSLILRSFILFHLTEFFVIGSFVLTPLIMINISLGLFNLIRSSA